MKKKRPRKPGHKKQKPQTFTKRKWFPKEKPARQNPMLGAAMGIGTAAEMGALMAQMSLLENNK